MHIPKEKRKRLDKKAEKGYFVGYNEDIKGFRIWFPETDRVDTKREVIFRKNDRYPASSTEIKEDDELQTFEFLEEPEIELQGCQPQELEPQIIEESEESTDERESDGDDGNSANDPFDPEDQEHEEEDVHVRPQEERVLRNRDRIRRPSRYDDGIDPDIILLAEGEEPQSYQEAITSSHATQWKRAMDEEIESLKKNNTWSIVCRQDGRKPIENRWIYKLKKKPDGSIDRFKARLVAKGYSQKQGVDYHETFSPVVKFDSIRIILAPKNNIEELSFTTIRHKNSFS